MGTAIRKTAEKSSEKLFELMKFRTIPNFRLTDLSLYHMIVLLGTEPLFSAHGRHPSISVSFSMIKGRAVSCLHEMSYLPMR